MAWHGMAHGHPFVPPELDAEPLLSALGIQHLMPILSLFSRHDGLIIIIIITVPVSLSPHCATTTQLICTYIRLSHSSCMQ
ncbi:hypothetical protein LX32DRAFT_646641 [Colletotrichum zoysiae]|uniref:Uncharacterized protein n=1 Tax=Colletotrichum zoysiae TaxID=1216348 RepID=A0AAD9LWV3_9PEZI|nr:hypothetical protein LX32DRAFT_646641 [Colletotrichum zoysiae]